MQGNILSSLNLDKLKGAIASAPYFVLLSFRSFPYPRHTCISVTSKTILLPFKTAQYIVFECGWGPFFRRHKVIQVLSDPML